MRARIDAGRERALPRVGDRPPHGLRATATEEAFPGTPNLPRATRGRGRGIDRQPGIAHRLPSVRAPDRATGHGSAAPPAGQPLQRSCSASALQTVASGAALSRAAAQRRCTQAWVRHRRREAARWPARPLDRARGAAGAELPGAAPGRRPRRRRRAGRGQERLDRLLPAREPRRGGLRRARGRALPRAPRARRGRRRRRQRSPRARGRRRRPLPAHPQALLPRRRARRRDRDHRRARPPGHRAHARPRHADHRQRARARDGQGRARAPAPGGARALHRARAERATRRARSPTPDALAARAAPRCAPTATPSTARSSTRTSAASPRRSSTSAAGSPRSSGCRRRRAPSTPSTTSSPHAVRDVAAEAGPSALPEELCA